MVIIDPNLDSIYINLIKDTISKNGLIAKDNLEDIYEAFGENIFLKVKYPFKVFEMSIKTIMQMKNNNFSAKYKIFDIDFDSIISIYLKPDDIDDIIYKLNKFA